MPLMRDILPSSLGGLVAWWLGLRNQGCRALAAFTETAVPGHVPWTHLLSVGGSATNVKAMPLVCGNSLPAGLHAL